MEPLPAEISVSQARLPQTYEAAKAALAECAEIDECQQWADRSEAMASCAKQAKDDGLRKMADCIQARAIRKCGELLQECQNERARTDLADGADLQTQARAGREAGLSERQIKTAVSVANVPESEFERQVESDNPLTVTAPAEQGKQSRPLVDLQGRDPEEYALATSVHGDLRRLARVAEETDAAVISRGTLPRERATVLAHVDTIGHWLKQLTAGLEQHLPQRPFASPLGGLFALQQHLFCRDDF